MKIDSPNPWVKDPGQRAGLAAGTVGETSCGGKAPRGAARRPGREEDHTDPEPDVGGYLVRVRNGNTTRALLKRAGLWIGLREGEVPFRREDGAGRARWVFSSTPPAYSDTEASVLTSMFSL